jgi:hypothetical protein
VRTESWRSLPVGGSESRVAAVGGVSTDRWMARAVRLDSVLRDGRLDVLKIDVEGYEEPSCTAPEGSSATICGGRGPSTSRFIRTGGLHLGLRANHF